MSVHIKAFVTYVLQQVFLWIRLKYSPWYSLLLMATAASAQRLVNCGGGGVSGQSTVAAASAVGWRRRDRSVGSGIGAGSGIRGCGCGGVSGWLTVALAASAVGWLRRRERLVGGVGTGSGVSSRLAVAA